MKTAPRSPSTTRPRLARRSHDKLIAGVASGIGDHFAIEPNLVRLAFVVLALAGGAGIVLYGAAWIFLPESDGIDTADAPAGRSARRERSDWVQIAALGAIVLGVLLLSRSIGLNVSDAIIWPVVLAAMGAALIVGRSGRPIDELIGELIRRERGSDTTGERWNASRSRRRMTRRSAAGYCSRWVRTCGAAASLTRRSTPTKAPPSSPRPPTSLRSSRVRPLVPPASMSASAPESWIIG